MRAPLQVQLCRPMCGKASFSVRVILDSSEATPRKMRRRLLEDLRETPAGKPEAFRTSGAEAAQGLPPELPRASAVLQANQSEALEPSTEELAVLSPFERFAFRVTHRMNRDASKRFWTWCQSVFGAGWIHISTYNLMRVYGLDHIEAVDHSRPVILVANHRSFFDMYVVSTTLFRKPKWRKQLFFPVRGRFYYQSIVGMFVNLIMGWWSMYPPFFVTGKNPLPEKRPFDKYSMRRLAQLCKEGAGNVIGFHPEGTRNKNDDPYSFLRPQPGLGKLIKEANPQVLPVFIAGLGNNLPKQVLGNWFSGPKIRVHFGKQLDLSQFVTKKDHVR